MGWSSIVNDKDALSLLADNPFPNSPPKFVRVQLYRYKFNKPGEEAAWSREYTGVWLPPLSKSNPEFKKYIEFNGWK